MKYRRSIYGAVALSLVLMAASNGFAKSVTGLDESGQLKLASQAKKVDELKVARLRDGVQIRVGKTVKNVIFYGPETVRVNSNLGKPLTEYASLVVVDKPNAPELKVIPVDGGFQIVSDMLTIKVDGKTGALSFYRPDGALITRENAQQPSEIKEVEISGAPTYEVKQRFTLSDDESLYGLGQYNDRYMDYRGKKVLLIQTNIGIVVPLLISTHRYGIMWDAYSQTTFEDNADGATFWSESSPAGVDYYFMAGDTMDDVIAGYRKLTGAAPMLSKKFFGLFMCKERYKTQDEVIDVVKKFRNVQFPLDTIVQDWQYWGSDKDGSWSGMTWTPDRYPDPAGMAKTLHDDLHVKLMISIWPSVGNDTALAKELDQYGLRFEPLHWISKHARIYDAFSEKGREIYFKHIKKGLLDVGVDALWMDGTEVEVGSACHDPYKVMADIKNLGDNAMGDFSRYLNAYSLMTTKGTYEGQRAISNKRVFTLTRSAYTGQQRYSALSWSGDTRASWDTLRSQIAGGLNVCMAGQPYWTQDTGGFFVYGNAERDPKYRELYARWNQFAIFNPIYRIHGTSISREPYLFKDMDPEMYDSMLDAAHLRYRLIPYIYGLAWQSTINGYTMMRGMAMDFPDDQNVRKLENQLMFGPSFLARVVDRAIYTAGEEAPESLVPGALLQTPDGQPGVAVQYYRGRNFEEAVSKTVEPQVNQTWPGPPLADFPEGIERGSDFSARYEAILTIPETGEYEIGTVADDGARLWIDDVQIVDDWRAHGMEYHGKKLSFTKGQKVQLKIEYYQGGGDRGLKLAWKTPEELASGDTGPDNMVKTYLPAGTWCDFWTNEKVDGGRDIERPCPLDIFPLYVRAGSIVPMSPAMQYVDEQPDAPYEIRIYPGADATFTIYEDDGETYNYEKGAFATIELKWNDAARTLTIGDRKGGFPELVKARKYRVVLATPDTAKGIDEAEAGIKEVIYLGKQAIVDMK